jgi:hypothetical protein
LRLIVAFDRMVDLVFHRAFRHRYLSNNSVTSTG